MKNLTTALLTLLLAAGCGQGIETDETSEQMEALATASLPGRIQAEDFNDGGEGVGYHDTTKGNTGKLYRTTDVDIEKTTDVGGGYNIAWVAAGEWLAYTVNVPQAGTFDFSARVSSASTGTKTVHLEIDGKALAAANFVPTGSWQTWRNVALGRTVLSAGSHKIVVHLDTAKFNLNYVDATLVCVPTSCAAQAKTCGSIADGCGGTLSCGGCATGSVCQQNVCVGTVSDKLVPSQGAWWGMSAEYAGAGRAANFRTREAQVGRQFDIYHDYMNWTTVFPSTTHQQFAAEGRMLMLNWKSPGIASWPQIARGEHDAQITTTANRIKAFGKKLFLTFHHEPENDGGNPADYAAAFRHVVTKFRALGVTNVVWVWNVMGYSGYAAQLPIYYPGDEYVDWIAYDPYNWYGCKSNTWSSLTSAAKWMYDWATANHPTKPLMLAEYGTSEHGGLLPTKGDWLRGLAAEARTNLPRIKAFLYFDVSMDCQWPLDTSADSLAGYTEAGFDPYFNPTR